MPGRFSLLVGMDSSPSRPAPIAGLQPLIDLETLAASLGVTSRPGPWS